MNEFNAFMAQYNPPRFGILDVLVVIIILFVFRKYIFGFLDKLVDTYKEGREEKKAVREFAKEYKAGHVAVQANGGTVVQEPLPSVDVMEFAAQSPKYQTANTLGSKFRALKELGFSDTEARARVMKDVEAELKKKK